MRIALNGWWRLWIVISVAFVAYSLIAEWPEPRELKPVVVVGRVGDLDKVKEQTRSDYAAQCAAGTESLTFERRVGIPANAEEESAAAEGKDSEDFPSIPKTKVFDLPFDKAQPYLVMRISCKEPGALKPVLLHAFVPPIVLLALGLGIAWIWRGFRPRKAAQRGGD